MFATRLRQGSMPRFFLARYIESRPWLQSPNGRNGWQRSLPVKHSNRSDGSREGGIVPRPMPLDPLTNQAGQYINMGPHNQQSRLFRARAGAR